MCAYFGLSCSSLLGQFNRTNMYTEVGAYVLLISGLMMRILFLPFLKDFQRTFGLSIFRVECYLISRQKNPLILLKTKVLKQTKVIFSYYDVTTICRCNDYRVDMFEKSLKENFLRKSNSFKILVYSDRPCSGNLLPLFQR